VLKIRGEGDRSGVYLLIDLEEDKVFVFDHRVYIKLGCAQNDENEIKVNVDALIEELVELRDDQMYQ
jgi:hypothetical protein